MSEILFQGKDHFGIWHQGSLIVKHNPSFVENVFWCSLIHDGALGVIVVIPETVGIYIGISDKRGAKLFVGSIFNYTEHAGYNMSSFTAEVVFDKECASFGYRKLGLNSNGVGHVMIHHFCEHDELSVDFLPYVEVIGNIYDTIK